MAFKSDSQRKAVMAILAKVKWSDPEAARRKKIERSRKLLDMMNARIYETNHPRVPDTGWMARTIRPTTKKGNPSSRAVGHILVDIEDTVHHGGKLYARTHSSLRPAWQGTRLGTALYLLSLRAAKKQGLAGLWSDPEDRSAQASKLWNSLRSRTVTLHGMKVDLLDSVRPHAKRRGQYLKKHRVRS